MKPETETEAKIQLCTEYNPYSYIRKGVFFKHYKLCYENEPLKQYTFTDLQTIQVIVHLLNIAFHEGCFYMADREWTTNKREQKLLTHN